MSATTLNPDQRALDAAAQLASGNSETMSYLIKQAEAVASDSRQLETYKPTIEYYKKTGEALQERERLLAITSTACWNPPSNEKDIEQLQTRLELFRNPFSLVDHSALTGVKELNADAIILVYDVTNDSQFLRGFQVDGRALEAKNMNTEQASIITKLDALFHQWFIKNGWAADSSGKMFVTDKAGRLTDKAVDPKIILERIQDKDQGLLQAIKNLEQLEGSKVSFEIFHMPQDLGAGQSQSPGA